MYSPYSFYFEFKQTAWALARATLELIDDISLNFLANTILSLVEVKVLKVLILENL